MYKQKQAIKRLSEGGCLPWQFKGFLALRKLLAVILLMLMAIPSFAGSDWDWSNGDEWRDAKFNASTRTWTWNTYVYDSSGADEGFVHGNNLSIFVVRNGVKTKVGEASSGEYGDNRKFTPNDYGKALGFESDGTGCSNASSDGGPHYWVKIKWKMPLNYVNERVQIVFEGKWTAWTSENKIDVKAEHDVGKTYTYQLATPKLDKDNLPKLWITGLDNGKVSKWEYRIPFIMENETDKSKLPENREWVNSVAHLQVKISTLDPTSKGSYKSYFKPLTGAALKELCDVNKNDDTNMETVTPKPGKYITLTTDSVVDKSQTKPNILRNGMSLLLYSTYYDQAEGSAAEIRCQVPKMEKFEDWKVPACPYPENLTATFIGTSNTVRISWVAKSADNVSGHWRLFSLNNGELTKLNSEKNATVTVPTRDTTYVEDIKVDATFFNNPDVTYIVAWEPLEVNFKEDSYRDKFYYFPELANSKTIDLTRYVQINVDSCVSEAQSIKFKWTTKTNANAQSWDGTCEIWTEEGRLAVVKPNAGTDVHNRTYEFMHISTICEKPENVQYEQSNLTKCSPHTYEIRASYGNASAQYTRAVFENKAIGCGIGFRSVDVSKGVYSNKVRVSAITNNPDGVKLNFSVQRKEYGTNDIDLSLESPVGTIGYLYNREAIVVDLGGSIGKVAVALKNVGATSIDKVESCYGKYFNADDANNPHKTELDNGWYVPSKDELDALGKKMTWNSTRKGLEWIIGDNSLFLPGAGYEYNGKQNVGTQGVYWSSTQTSHSYRLDFNASRTVMYEGLTHTTVGCKVRPFCKLPAKNEGFTEVYSQSNGSATLTWEDFSAESGKYYIYKVVSYYKCEDDNIVSIDNQTVGFCQNTGFISGKITYNGGSAAQDINLDLTVDPLDSLNYGRNMLHSLSLADAGFVKWNIPDKSYASHLNDGNLTVQFWVCPEATINKATTLFALGELQLTTDASGKLYLNKKALTTTPTLTPNQWQHITLSYNKKQGTCAVTIYRPVSTNGIYERPSQSQIDGLTQTVSDITLKMQRTDCLTLGGAAGQYDDFRLFSRLLTQRELIDTYDRHLHGEENGLEIYWTFNDGIPEYAFDTSRTGTQLNGRHGTVVNGNEQNNANVHTGLGFRTRTDQYGNYVMRGIPFDGDNVSYYLTPSYPDHTFSPENRMHIVGNGALVFNGSEFQDVSSFPFYGNVTYMYGDIPADSIAVLVDGVQQSNGDGLLYTDINGNFRVDVPIGEHYISLQRKGHVLQNRWPAAEGTYHNFVSAEGLGTEASPIHFTDSTLTLVAGHVVGGDIEAARPLGAGLSKANIGRGTVTLQLATSAGYKINTSDKPIDVAYHLPSELDDDACEAQLLPQSGKVRIRTNATTGEFYAWLPPVSFAVDSVKTKDFYSYGLQEDFGSTACYGFTPLPTDTVVCDIDEKTEFRCNYRLDFVRHNDPTYELIDLTAMGAVMTDSVFKEYFEKNVPANLNEVEKRRLKMSIAKQYFGDASYDVGNGNKIGLLRQTMDNTLNPQNTEDMKKLYHLNYPVYSKEKNHGFLLSAFEIYTNSDDATEVKVDSVPLEGRAIHVVNGLGCVKYQADGTTPEIPLKETGTVNSYGYLTFTIAPAMPNLTAPYLLNLSLTDNVTGKEFFNLPAYVFGDKPIEGTSFVTKGPEFVDYVIHDPYGTNSSAWLEKGSTVSKTHSITSLADKYTVSNNCALSVKLEFGSISGINWSVALSGAPDMNFDPWDVDLVFVQLNLAENTDYKQVWTNGSDIQRVTTNTERISTSDSPDYVGPPADLFVGNSTNVFFSETNKLGLWSNNSDPNNVPKTIDDVKIDIRNAITYDIKDTTRFSYTRHHIETELIPELKRLRREIFREPFDKKLGTYTMDTRYSVDDPDLDWSVNCPYSEWTAASGDDAMNYDLAKFYTESIKNWIARMRDDEMMQASYHQSITDTPENYSINTGVTYNKSHSGKVAYTHKHTEQETVNENVTIDFGFNIKVKVNSTILTGVGITLKGNVKTSSMDNSPDNKDVVDVTNDTWSSNLNWGYQLKETVAGNYVSQDVYTTELDTITVPKELYDEDLDANNVPDGYRTLLFEGSPIFILRGGQTRSPWEKALHMKYCDLNNPGNPDNIIGADTQPLCIPVISFPGEVSDHQIELFHQRAGHDVTIPLKLESLSPQTVRGIDYILTAYANDDATALQMKVDGSSIVGTERSYRLTTGKPIYTPLVVRQARPDKYDFDTWIYLLAQGQSSYDSPMGYIADSVRLIVHFDPTSSDVSITPGAGVLNLDSKGNLQLRVDDYDRHLDNFCCIDLMYRRPDEGEFNHTFARYWVNEDVMKAYGTGNAIPILGKEFQQAELLPEGPRFVHNFDMSQMYDGEYYITAVARSYYPDGAGGTTKAFAAEYQCEPVHILKDMKTPEVLGRPTPTNNYLTIRDQAVATFTEDINTNRLVKYRNVLAYLKDGETLTPVDIDFSADERHIYIDLEPSRRQVHGKYVRFVLKGVEDMAGNAMADSVAWDAYADLSTFDWDHEVVNITATVSELASLSFSPVLLNNTQRAHSYELKDDPYSDVHQLPSWLTAVTRGTLPALSTTPIEFRIAGTPEIGKHQATVFVVSDSGTICTPLTVNLTVVGDEPDIPFDFSRYPHNMSVIARVEVPEGEFKYPNRDLIYAFAGTTCVGKSFITHKTDTATNKVQRNVFMEVYGDDVMNMEKTEIHFVAWDAATNTLYPTVTSSEPLHFKDNMMVGTVASPLVLNIQDDTQIGIAMTEGWNWTSFNVELGDTIPAILTPLLQHSNTVTAKTNTEAVTMSGGNVSGDLQHRKADPTAMYAIKLDGADLLRLVGKPVDPATHPVTLAGGGWTWIGYTPQGYNNVSAALANLKATEGDIIKSQTAFSMYHVNGSGSGSWYGELEALYPGQGYKYLSNNASDVQFCYAQPKSAVRSKARRLEAADNHWDVTTHYADNMTVLGCVVEDGNVVTHGEIGCFVGTECRGRARVESNGYAFIVVQGVKTGESVQCYYWNDESETEHMVSPALSYANDASLGTFANPVQLILDDTSGIVEVDEADGDYEYYNLQGLRVDRLALQRGSIYIRSNGIMSDKILKK